MFELLEITMFRINSQGNYEHAPVVPQWSHSTGRFMLHDSSRKDFSFFLFTEKVHRLRENRYYDLPY